MQRRPRRHATALAAVAVTAGIAFASACGDETPQGEREAIENAVSNSPNTQDRPGSVTESRTAGTTAEGTAVVVEIPAAKQGLAFAKGKGTKGASYANEFALPNFYFHLVTSYAILRHNGVDLGKMDFIGQFEMLDM